MLLGIILKQIIKAYDINVIHVNELYRLKGILDWTKCFNMTKYYLADPGEARGCSTYTSVINSLINSFIH